jgi:hypothetical protein
MVIIYQLATDSGTYRYSSLFTDFIEFLPSLNSICVSDSFICNVQAVNTESEFFLM